VLFGWSASSQSMEWKILDGTNAMNPRLEVCRRFQCARVTPNKV
jgi:hypothetical protein